MPANLVIRADAGPQIGTGHVMRCLALAEPWLQAGSGVTMVSSQLPATLEERIKFSEIKLQMLSASPGGKADAKELAQIAKKQNADWIVVDGYHFDADYQRGLKKAGLRVLFFDDFGHAKHYCADFVLNQNLGADENLYPSREPQTQLLLGTSFVQLRNEFSKWRDWRRTIPPLAKKILVTLGGSDSENVTLKAVRAIRQIPDLKCEATIVIGGGNPHGDELKSVARNSPAIRILQNAGNMPELMAEVDLAIAAGGTTAWELAFMGLPALMIVMADNQRSNAEQLQSAGVARNLGWHENLTPEKIAAEIIRPAGDFSARGEMSRRGRELVDGLGNFRVWLRLNENGIHLRRATAGDARLIWEWANEPAARAASFSSEAIEWNNHAAWFNAKLSDANCLLWIGNDADENPAGVARFDLQNEAAVISVSLDKTRRGKNLGALLIQAACRKLFRETAATVVNAFVKPDNQASIRAFQKSGFEAAGGTVVKGQPALRFQLHRGAANT
ncbi:MAG: UDP-2,4-diacetamido-2,4,6-trideoxy-beta-L-altropyranose hydrolase [Verrucomicrobiota bacterium]